MSEQLGQLYQEARTALKSKDYARASDLFRQILLVDENFKDASRLLAQTVKLKRRRWYSHPLLWGGLGLAVLVALGVWLAPLVRGFYASQIPTAAVLSTALPNQTSAPSPTPTPVPLVWKRIAMGLEFPRDTITTIVVDPKDSEVIYIGTENAGIYKTIDGGNSWHPIHNGLGNARIVSLLIDPQDPEVLYASVQSGGIYTTYDGGNNWQGTYPTGAFSERGSFMAMDPQNSSHLYFADGLSDTGISIYESTDAGLNWTAVHGVIPASPLCTANTRALAIHPVNGNSLLTSVDTFVDCPPGSMYLSKDSGQTWAAIGSEYFKNDQGYVYAIGTDRDGNDVFFVSSSELYTSHDQGNTWVTQAFSCGILKVDHNNPTTAYCGTGNTLYVTSDGGLSWNQLSTIEGSITALWVSDDGSRLIVGTQDGFLASNDGGSHWLEQNSGLGNMRFELKSNPSGSILYTEDTLCNLYRSSDRGNNWESLAAEGCGLAFDPDGSNLYRTSGNKILRSSNAGETWVEIPLPLDSDAAAIEVTSNNALVVLLFNEQVLTSMDGGSTWSEGSMDNPANLGWGELFVGEQYIYTATPWNIYRSEDDGISWQACVWWEGWLSTTTGRMAVDPQNDSRVFISIIGKGLYVSMDACQRWQPSSTGLGSLFVNTIAIDPNDPNTIYAGTDGGAYVSFDGGGTWNQINDGLLGATVVYSIVVDSESNVYASTPYGIFRLEGR